MDNFSSNGVQQKSDKLETLKYRHACWESRGTNIDVEDVEDADGGDGVHILGARPGAWQQPVPDWWRIVQSAT